MANYRQIHVSIWKDEWFLDLDPSEKLLFIYLFSNEATSLAGIYKLPLKVVIFETGLDRQLIEDTLTKFSMVGKVFYENGIVWVTNMRRYHETKSSKVQTRIDNDLKMIPECPLKIRYLYGIDTRPQLKEEEEKDETKNTLSTFVDRVSPELSSPSPPSSFVLSAERIFTDVTGMATFPGNQRHYIDIVDAMRDTYGVERTMEAMRNQYAIWCSTKRKDGSRNYSGLNLTWIDRAQEELAPSPVAVRVKETKDMTSAEFHEYLLGKDAQHDS